MPRLETTHEAMRHYYRGRVFESTGEIDIAVSEYKKAIELGADYADIHNSMGRAYAKKGQFVEASKEFQCALQMNPHYLEAQRNLIELETRLTVIQKEKENTTISRKLFYKTESRPGKRRKFPLVPVLSIVAGIVLFTLTSVLVTNMIFPAKLKKYTAPSENVTGISFDDKDIWLCDWFKQEIYCAKIIDDELIVKKTYSMKTSFPIGVAIGKNYLWTCDGWNKKISKHMYDNDLSILASYPSPGNNPSSLCFDGENLWSTDADSKKIYKHSMDEMNLSPETVYKSPCSRPMGFSYDGKNYWSVDGDNNIIYKHRKNMNIIDQYQMNFPNKKLSAVLVDKKNVWIAFEGDSGLLCYPRSKILKQE
ncbi:MAG: hypothetical protein A2252_11975 [Elusimicrobia bacterium RIFOXYA2_FULL_39_19]|nr:MAG: hypothetical protein A2252_11975 [Elusimicrobia bacterium RIFOXYA2_FULL_39_19]